MRLMQGKQLCDVATADPPSALQVLLASKSAGMMLLWPRIQTFQPI